MRHRPPSKRHGWMHTATCQTYIMMVVTKCLEIKRMSAGALVQHGCFHSPVTFYNWPWEGAIPPLVKFLRTFRTRRSTDLQSLLSCVIACIDHLNIDLSPDNRNGGNVRNWTFVTNKEAAIGYPWPAALLTELRCQIFHKRIIQKRIIHKHVIRIFSDPCIYSPILNLLASFVEV